MQIQVRDPVHGFVRLREKEARLLGTKPLQRLRGIRQLALASLVYPGALHTRFDHTLGVTHVAGMMAQTLALGQDESDLIRYAALLHDIGHGPFSHVSEYALDRYADTESLPSEQKREKIHERIAPLVICNDDEIVRILGLGTCEDVVALLGNGLGEPVVRSVISGPLDADKQDYLLRDSYFCGVQYGVFDLHQLHRSLTAYGGKDDRFLMISGDGVHAVEQYALAKYYLTTNVYRHKVRLITDQMIHRAIALGIEKDGNDTLHSLYRFDNTVEFAQRYMEWDDAEFLLVFGTGSRGSSCAKVLDRLRRRELLKRVFSEGPPEFAPEARDGLLALVGRSQRAVRVAIEKEVAELIQRECRQVVDPDLVILHAFDVKSVKEMARNDESGIMVLKGFGPVPFGEESSLFGSIDERLREESVEVYAPIAWSTRADRERIRKRLREPIIRVIEGHCRAARPGDDL